MLPIRDEQSYNHYNYLYISYRVFFFIISNPLHYCTYNINKKKRVVGNYAHTNAIQIVNSKKTYTHK